MRLKGYIKRLAALTLAAVMCLGASGTAPAAQDDTQLFSDVPQGHWAAGYIYAVRDAGLLSGVGDGLFGLGNPLSRAEFVTYLCKLLELDAPESEAFVFGDVHKDDWFYQYVNAALANGIIEKADQFYPTKVITREEMAILSVKALGYGAMAERMKDRERPFPDVTRNIGYITIAADFGLMGDTGGNRFLPDASATREQGAGIFWNLYSAVKGQDGSVSAFYAISSSSQMNVVPSLDSVSFGWCRLERDESGGLSLNTTTANKNEYYVPPGYQQPYDMAKERLLMVAVDGGLANEIIASDTLRQQTIVLIADAVDKGLEHGGERLLWDGCVIDFETLKGAESRENFNSFLRVLRTRLPRSKIHVAVHPVLRSGSYYDGYDYKTIGMLADKVILMAHDYNAKQLTDREMEQGMSSTPLAPIDDVYHALKAATDEQTGVGDKSKLVLQLNFGTAQWKLKGGRVQNRTPYQPGYDLLLQRMRSGADAFYSVANESPYLYFFNSEDGTDNVVWYENARSISAKIQLARYFGVYDLSVWRLGSIPDDGAAEAMNVLDVIV